MPGSQISSLFALSQSIEPPHWNWLELARTPEEAERVMNSISGCPRIWLDWTESLFKERVKRNPKIKSELRYKELTLLRGIIAMQECKYICDLIENAFRHALIQHIDSLGFQDPIQFSICGYPRLNPKPQDLQQAVCRITFGNLIQTISKYWRHYPNGSLGFRRATWKSAYCRQLSNFSRDMKLVRETRNKVAHSNTLISIAQTIALLNASAPWLKSLGVDICQKSAQYRQQRPRFLHPAIS